MIIILNELFKNRMLNTAIFAWFIAQVIKIFLHLIVNGNLDLKLISSSGGMPSSHSAIVCSLAVCIGKEYGFNSPLFAFVTVMAMIVMYDATGVRRATGEQAKALNKIIDIMSLKDNLQVKIKEVLGHKPLEVFVGAILGILIGSFY